MATYYVKNSGDDLLDGLSDSTAWASLSKANSAHSGGDTVLFKQGDTWRVTPYNYLRPKAGSLGAITTFSSYTDGGSGAGKKPMFLGSKSEMLVSDWTNVSGNLWENSDPDFSTQVGNIIFNSEASCGIRVLTSTTDVNSQGKFFWDPVTYKLTLYSTSNPATYYTSIECALYINPSIIYIGSRSYVTIDGLELKYGARHAISVSATSVSNITIKNCNISYIGGGRSGTLRLGNGIEFWGGGTNILIEKNNISQIYDSGITNQYMSGSATVNNFVVRYNIIDKCEMGVEFWQWTTTGGSVTNVYFQNNTFANSGYGWCNGQRNGNYHGDAFYASFMDNISPLNNIYVRNNIFYNSLRYGLYLTQNWCLTSVLNCDYNLFYLNTYVANAVSVNYTTLASWQSASIHDDNSVSANPVFTDSTNFHILNVTGGGINKGIDVGYLSDFDGNPIVEFPDIGAFEFSQESYGASFINTNLNKVTTFPTVTIGTQVWMARNWDWKTGSYPNGDEDNVNDYGVLYTWQQAKDIADSVSGWRLPTVQDFATLYNYLGGASVAGGHLKEIGTIYWDSPNTGADNSSGFSARGAGNGGTVRYTNYLWGEEVDSTTAISLTISCNSAAINIETDIKTETYSIRLIKE